MQYQRTTSFVRVFPCQPFSKAGDQEGFACPQWGDLFDYIIKILRLNRPEFFIIENVPNLVRHKKGKTWRSIQRRLRLAGYCVSDKLLSPHHFAVPQIRERAFIVGRRGDLGSFQWPEPMKGQSFSISSVLDENPPEGKKLPQTFVRYLQAWQRFLDRFPDDEQLPSFQIWAMEFGATYPYEKQSPEKVGLNSLGSYRGSFGLPLKGLSEDDVLAALPPYARGTAQVFPEWKVDFIRQNRDLYKRHKDWIDEWLPSILDFAPSFQKFEWNCKGERRRVWDYVIQFRASGIRLKRPSTAPSLVAMTTSQVPVIGWERRYMTIRECSRLRSMGELKYLRLQNLRDLLRSLSLAGSASLIIDDEADQASLNNEISQGQESTTYRCLMELRRELPNHTYVQYTATPQAPLLVSIIDSLSPNFIQLLEPGTQYVGGREFFADRRQLVRVIPPEEVPTNKNPLSAPPDSLIDALRVFMVGVTAGILVDPSGNRSMLVHPSHRTTQHREFYNWVRDIIDEWRRILSLPETDLDRQQLMGEFREAYADLAQTVGADLPAFDDLVPYFKIAFRNTLPLEVNAVDGKTPPVNWRSTYGWILVGGQAMDRGFTVQGLTVTYMPRGIGVGNANTVQQRARFFGYKREYLGYCRVYLEEGTISAFESYVEHEEDIRAQLREIQESGTPLNDWKRAFILDNALQPCRGNVIEFDFMRGRFADSWVAPRVVLSPEAVVESSRQAVANFINTLQFSENTGHADRTETQKHFVCSGVSLRTTIEQLMVRMRITGTTDSQRYVGMLLQLSKALQENPDEVCSIYRMSKGEHRNRSVDENGEVTNLYQGAYPVQPKER